VLNITALGAYEKAVMSTLPFDTVIHAASPFLYCIVNDNSEFLVPALNGTKEILKAVKALALSVMRVIITRSCVAVVDHPSEAAKPATAESKKYTKDD
jgi:nucleoside-diphosphate-sugar epimerase